VQGAKNTVPTRQGESTLTLTGDFTRGEAAPILDALTTVVSHAAATVLTARAAALNTRSKSDLSPVTTADEAAEAIILEGVGRVLPGLPIVSEEAAYRTRPEAFDGDFVLVDPVDGTRELVAGRDEFTINVAVVRGGHPVLGIIAAPARGLVWRTAAGGGAERFRLAPGAPAAMAQQCTPIRSRPFAGGPLVAAISRSHLDPQSQALLARLAGAETMASGSAIKLCWIADGSADLYPRLAPTREWDVAAGHAIVAAAGGVVTRGDGEPLFYGRRAHDFLIPSFIAWADPTAPTRLGL
jgi:3'(2'), 5'-bisphosphate nucleotidase